MTQRPSKLERLDKLLSGLDAILLSTPDNEVRSESGEPIPIDDVRALIASRIAPPRPSKARRGVTRKRNSRRKEILAFLRSLLETRPDLRPQLNAVLAG